MVGTLLGSFDINKKVSQCLKIAQKVALNIASEASYVLILSVTKID